MSIMPKDLQASDIINQIALISGLSDQQLQQASQNPKYGWMAGIVAAHRTEDRAPNPPMPQGTVIGQKLAQLQGGIPAGMGNQQAMAQANPMSMGIAAAPENIPGAATGGLIALAHGGEVRGFSGLEGSSVGSYDPVTGIWSKHPYHESARAATDPVGQPLTSEDIEAEHTYNKEKPRYKTAPADVKDVYNLQGMTPEQAAEEIKRLRHAEKMQSTQVGHDAEIRRLDLERQIAELDKIIKNQRRPSYADLAQASATKADYPSAYNISEFGDPAEMERLTPNTKGADYSNLEATSPPQEMAYPREQAKVWPTQTMKAKTSKIDEATAKLQAEKEAQEIKGGKKKKGKKAAPEAPPAEGPSASEAPQPEQPTWGKTREQAEAEFEAGRQAPPAEDIPLGTKAEAADAWTGEAAGKRGAGIFTPTNAALALSESPVGKAGLAGPAIASGSRSPEAYQNLARGIYSFAHPIDSTVENVKDFGQGIVGLGRAALHPVDTAKGLYREGTEKLGAFGRDVSTNAEEMGNDIRDWIQSQSWRDAGTQEPSLTVPPAHDTAHGDKPGQVKADPNAPGHTPTPKPTPHPEAIPPSTQATPSGQSTAPAGGMTVSAPGGITNTGARTTTVPGGIAGSTTDDQQLAWYKHMLGDSAYHAPETLNAEWEKQKENLARDKWGLAAVRGIAGMISAPTEHWGKALGIGLGEAASQYAAGAKQEEDLAEKSLARAEADAKADYDFNQQAAKLHIAERAAKARDDADLRKAMAVANAGYDTAIAKLNYKNDLSGSLTLKDALAQATKDWREAVLQDPRLQDADSTAWINNRANQLMQYGVSAAPQSQGRPASGARYIFDPNMGVRTAG